MGQLEKYGLYVLCILIFLICGVTLWGSPEVNAQIKERQATGANELNAIKSQVVDPPRNKLGDGDGDVQSGVLPDIGSIWQTTTPPKPEDKKAGGAGGRNTGGAGGDNDGGGGESVAPEPPAVEVRRTHIIASGDTFSEISTKYYGTIKLTSEIARLNQHIDPRKMPPGKEVKLPTAAEVERILGKKVLAQVPVAAGGSYVIVKGDTLEGIAIKQLGSRKYVAAIRDLNPGLRDRNLKVGSPIKLPKK